MSDAQRKRVAEVRKYEVSNVTYVSIHAHPLYIKDYLLDHKCKQAHLTMPREGDRSTPLWQKTTYTVYLRIAIIVASGLALTAAAIALNTALHKQEDDDPATIAGNDVEENPDSDSERRNGANILRETIGSLIAATSATILIQTMLILVTKFSPYIYEPAGSTHLCIQLVVSFNLS